MILPSPAYQYKWLASREGAERLPFALESLLLLDWCPELPIKKIWSVGHLIVRARAASERLWRHRKNVRGINGRGPSGGSAELGRLSVYAAGTFVVLDMHAPRVRQRLTLELKSHGAAATRLFTCCR